MCYYFYMSGFVITYFGYVKVKSLLLKAIEKNSIANTRKNLAFARIAS